MYSIYLVRSQVFRKLGFGLQKTSGLPGCTTTPMLFSTDAFFCPDPCATAVSPWTRFNTSSIRCWNTTQEALSRADRSL